jgi:hypothetical protein
MPKPIVNNRINYQNTQGRIIQHDLYLNQGVRSGDSPTFSNLRLTGDATIEGNLYVEGNTSLLDTAIVEFRDNIILVNNQETGAGVTLHQAGFEIDRGTLETFRVVYNELNSRVEVGVISDLKPIALRESSPLSNGLMIWNPSSNLIESTNQITIPITFTSTENSISSTSGTFIIAGGMGIKKDVFIDGKIYFTGSNLPNYSVIYTDPGTNTLNINSVQDINLSPSGKVLIAYDKQIAFGSSTQSISANSLTNNLSITSSGDINLSVSTGKKINVPNQIPITFSTQNEKIYTDSSNNMVIAGSQDIYLYPNNGSGGKKIFIPVDTSLAFGTSSQSILANINNDLSVNANNNIFLNPGNTLDIKIPTDAGLRFGSGYQRITANSNNDLLIYSTGDLYLNSSLHVKLPSGIPLTFANNTQYIYGDSNGNMIFGSSNKLIMNTQVSITNTENSINASTGSIYTSGGIGVKKDIYSESSIKVNSSNNTALQISNLTDDILVVDTSSNGKVNVFAGDGTSNNPSIEISDYSLLNAQSLIQLKGAFDNTNGYMIGRGTVTLNDGRTFTANLPNYTEYSNTGPRAKFSITSNNCSTELFSIESETGNISTLGTFGLSNTNDSTSPTTGAVIINGGLGVVKSIYTSGKYVSSVDSITAFQIQDSSNTNIFNIDTVTQNLTVNQKSTFATQDANAFKITDNTEVVLNVDTLNTQLSTTLQILSLTTIDSNNTSSGSIIANGGVAIQKSLNVGGNSSFHNGINMVNTSIINVLNPINAQDVATKSYVDLVKQGLFVKDSVNVATVIPGDLNTDFIAGNSIDNYILLLGDRILIKNQTNGIENGIYTITNGTSTRSVDLQTGVSASGIFTFIKSGDINNSLGWICNSQSPSDIVDSDTLSFTEFTGLGQVQAGSALSKNFNELNVNVDNTSLEIISDSLRIKNTATGTGLTGGSGDPLQTTSDQSHVTKLGTIDTGVWQGSNIGVEYGGTGTTTIPIGNILFGNGNNPINTDPNFYFDNNNIRLGLGTNVPTTDIEIKSNNTISLLLNADSDANNLNAKPEIIFSYNGGGNNSYIGMTRNYDEYSNNIYNDALVLHTPYIIQFATAYESRLTILENGFVGINTTIPSATLDINGTLNVSNNVQVFATEITTSISNGSVYIAGGVAIGCLENSFDYSNGGSLSVGGGASIGRDLYVGGSLICNSASTSTFSYMTITATDEAINITSGALVTFGGITIQCETDSSSNTNGGALLVAGGASVSKSVYIGNNLYVTDDTYLHNLYFTSSNSDNYIQAPNPTQTTNSFLPTHFTQYNNTTENILTIANSGIILNEQHSFQIGGTLDNVDGYTIQFTTPCNLNIIPNSVSSDYNINIGTIGNYSNLNVYGSNDGQIRWQSTSSNLLLTNSTIQLNKLNSTGSVVLTTPDTLNNVFLQASGANMTMNLGEGSIGGQLTTILSNNTGDSSITFTPSNSSVSSLILTNNVYSTFNGPVDLSNRVEYSGNALHQTITNTSGNSIWYYFGELNTFGSESGYTEIDFYNGVNTSVNNDITGLKLTVAINNTNCISSHSHYGNIVYNSNQKPVCYIYNDTFNDYKLFVKIAPNSQTNVNVLTQRNTKFLLLQEGSGSEPDGSTSGYTSGTWLEEYATNMESTLKYTTGDLIVEGTTLKICDNLPIIGYNNINTTKSRDLGILFQRYQIANNSGTGDIADDDAIPKFIDSIPNQSLIVVLDQIKFSALADASDDYYIGWWIKMNSGSNTNQVRKIIEYNGAQRVATLETPFTTQNPSTGDTVNFYNNGYAVSYYDETNDTFGLGYTNSDPQNGSIDNNNNANLRIRSLYSTDTTVSTNSSSGSVYLLGGISIDNTNDAVSATLGGTITTAGGVSINKNLIVGTDIGIGRSGFTPEESLHIRKVESTIRLENDTSSFSYIDFVENSTNNRYGILLDSSTNELSLTNSTTNNTPNNSNKALTINNTGYVGINTTSNVVSPLGIKVNNFISTNSSTGYLGLIGGASNINSNTVGSRLLLNANSQLSNISSGCLNLYAGNVTSGNVSIFTNNDIERLRIDNSGSVFITSTTISDSNSTGSLITNGGVCISCTQNSTSITSGGALTVGGGASVTKDLYIGGNIYIQGAITAAGSITNPTLSFVTFTNCSLVEFYNNNLSVSGNLGILTFGITLQPNVESTNTEVIFELPERTNAFIKRFEVVSNASGYTDDTNVIPLFNLLSFGVLGTNQLAVKFQSVSTASHYLQIQCTYTLA